VEIIKAKNIDGEKVKTFTPNYSLVPFLAILLVFFKFWSELSINFTKYCMGFMISKWFFYKHKTTIFLPLKEVLVNAGKYHLGSIVFYTLIRFFFGFLIDSIDYLY
jgi:hypothetical protein